jgi:hypothetical protein
LCSNFDGHEDVEGLYKPSDVTKVHVSPHKIPSGFRGWIPTFSDGDIVSARHHLDTFSEVFNSCASRNQYEDVCIKIFSSSLIGKAKEWYNNIPPKTITTWEMFETSS